MELRDPEEIRIAVSLMASGNTDALDRVLWTALFGRDAAARAGCRAALTAEAGSRGLLDEPVNGGPPVSLRLRGLPYEAARAVFRAARALPGLRFTVALEAEPPLADAEDRALLLRAAALREGWRGPLQVREPGGGGEGTRLLDPCDEAVLGALPRALREGLGPALAAARPGRSALLPPALREDAVRALEARAHDLLTRSAANGGAPSHPD
jgi:hypothetical protein